MSWRRRGLRATKGPLRIKQAAMSLVAGALLSAGGLLPAEAAQRPSDATWDRLAGCESGGRWADTRGGYEGGLHWVPSTWRRAVRLYVRGHPSRRFPAHAYQATRRMQIDVANDWLARTSWATQWPACSRKLGLR